MASDNSVVPTIMSCASSCRYPSCRSCARKASSREAGWSPPRYTASPAQSHICGAFARTAPHKRCGHRALLPGHARVTAASTSFPAAAASHTRNESQYLQLPNASRCSRRLTWTSCGVLVVSTPGDPHEHTASPATSAARERIKSGRDRPRGPERVRATSLCFDHCNDRGNRPHIAQHARQAHARARARDRVVGGGTQFSASPGGPPAGRAARTTMDATVVALIVLVQTIPLSLSLS